MSAHRTLNDAYRAFEPTGPGRLEDPGDTNTITFALDRQICSVVTAAAETRTLAQPNRPGILAGIAIDTYVGDLTLTVTGGYNEDADTSIVFGSAAAFIVVYSIKVGTAYYWRVLGQEGTTASVEEGAFDSLTAGAITGGDNSLGITGQAQATTVNGGLVAIAGAASIAGATGNGGAATVTGGASGSTAGDGGAASLTGGLGTTTGDGGAATVAGGVGGSSTGDGGAAAVAGGAAPGSNANGGAASLTGGATTAGAAGTGGAATVAGGANGNTTNGAGGAASVTGGAGKGSGAGGAAGLTGGASAGSGAGGNVTLTGGTSGSGIAGAIVLASDMFFAQDEPTAEADGAQAIAAADFVNGIVVHTVTEARTLTTPTGAQIAAVLPAGITTGHAFRLHVITVGAGGDDISTLTAGDGDVTFVGNVTVGPDAAGTSGFGTWIFRMTGATSFVGYRVG